MNDRFDLETASSLAGVHLSDLQRQRLCTYVRLLRRWQQKQNLVSGKTLEDVWSRHIADSLQLLPLIAHRFDGPPRLKGLRGVDLGSGGGLPGAVLALAGAVRVGSAAPSTPISMSLIEATHRKVAFLRAVSRETDCPFDVLAHRLESFASGPIPDAHFISARALAPLGTLVNLAEPWLEAGATAFFHKGGEYARELDEWSDVQRYVVVQHISVVDAASRILEIQRRVTV